MNLSVPTVATIWRAALTALLLLLAVANSLAQRSHDYYVSLGSAITASGDWGDAHEAGFAGEVGLIRPIGSWDFVGSAAYERFDIRLERDEFEYLRLYDPPMAGEPRFGPLRGGPDQLITVRGGFRRTLSRANAFRPYAGALLGLSVATQDRAHVDRTIEGSEGPETTRIILTDNNSQLGVGFTAVIGLSTPVGGFGRMFLESGYTFILTPDDSIDDNPSFFPIRVGVVF